MPAPVVVHARGDRSAEEDVEGLERKSLRLVAHEDVGDPGVTILHSVVPARTGGVELQHAPVTQVVGIEDFAERCHESVVPDAENRRAIQMQGSEEHPVRQERLARSRAPADEEHIRLILGKSPDSPEDFIFDQLLVGGQSPSVVGEHVLGSSEESALEAL